MAQEIYLKLHIFQHKAHPLILIGIVDSYRKGRKFFNIKISDPEILNMLSFDKILITSVDSVEVIHKGILNRGVPEDKIITLD